MPSLRINALWLNAPFLEESINNQKVSLDVQMVLSRIELTLASLPASSSKVHPKNVQTRFTVLTVIELFPLLFHTNPVFAFVLHSVY